MFCRIEVLRRNETSTTVIVECYASGSNMGAIQEIADRMCRVMHAPGYRVRDLHTHLVEEVWN